MSKTWIVILTIIITAAIFGGGTYYYLNAKATEEKANLQSQIEELEKNYASLQSQVNKSTSQNDTENNNDTVLDDTKTDNEKEICYKLYPNAQNVQSDEIKTDIGTYCRVTKNIGEYASGTIGEVLDNSGGGSGATWLAAKVDGIWNIVLETQDYFDCNKLEKYDVPADLLDNDGTCYDYDAQEYKQYVN